MTTKTANAKAPPARDKNQLDIPCGPEKTKERKLAEVGIDPTAHGMASLRLYSKGSFGDLDVTELYLVLAEYSKAASKGDLTHHRQMLAAQADALNAIFTEMARRAAANMGEYINATQLDLRLGLKAQAQCRSTIETLESMTSGHVQTVKHVHVNEGGQAVIADEFHHHTRGQENGQSSEQPHTTGAIGSGDGPALPSPHPLRPAVPVASREGQAAVPNARRQGKRRT